jgi:hypothetical protein
VVATTEARAKAVSLALESADGESQGTMAILFRGEKRELKKVRISVNQVVLNPRSHRIRAQLETHPAAEEIGEDPFGEAAQEQIAEIIRSIDDTDYSRLKESLQEHGQQEPGVVTHQGVLVNANTRLVAMRELGESWIEVGVLPSDATDQDILLLESDLQFKKILQFDYTFTNRLLFMQEMLNGPHYSKEDLAKALNLAVSSEKKELAKGVASVERDMRILHWIRRIQESGEGDPSLSFFDDKAQMLIYIDEEYEKTRDRDAILAARVRDARTVGLLLNQGYKRINMVEADHVDRYLLPAMRDEDAIGDKIVSQLMLDGEMQNDGRGSAETDSAAGEEIPQDDSDLLADPTESDAHTQGPSLAPLVSLLAQTAELKDETKVRLLDETDSPKGEIFGVLGWAYRTATDEIADDRRNEDDTVAPSKRILEATKKLEKARQCIPKASEQQGFDQSKVDSALRAHKKAVQDLEAVIESSSGSS